MSYEGVPTFWQNIAVAIFRVILYWQGGRETLYRTSSSGNWDVKMRLAEQISELLDNWEQAGTWLREKGGRNSL
jgi:hypothetical protein